MASTIEDADLSGDLGEMYEDATNYHDDISEVQEEDGEFEDAIEEFPEEIIECTDIVAEQRYDAEGVLECRFEGKQYWHPACHHIDIRHQLYNDAAQMGEYDFAREAGDDPRDKTSFLPSQKSWGLDRAHRPQELFAFEQPQNHRTRVLGNVQPMYRYQRIVLDFQNKIIKDYEHIPDTLSSEFEGALMEAITRKDVRIGIEDFRSRMLERITLNRAQRELYKFNIFSSRMRRFREASFNLVWTVKRSGSEAIKDFMASFLPPACKTSNSTRNFRDMYKHEMVLKEMLGFGRSLFRAGSNGRAVTPTSREASYKKSIAKYDKLYATFTKEQHKLANGLLPHSSTRQLESPAYHQLLINWRATIDRQREEVADEEDEDKVTASDEGILLASKTIANVEDEHAASTSHENAITRKRSFAEYGGEDVHEGHTSSSKRLRHSPTNLFLDVIKDNSFDHDYDLDPGFLSRTFTDTASVSDPTPQAHVQASRGQKRGFVYASDDKLVGRGTGFHSQPGDSQPLNRFHRRPYSTLNAYSEPSQYEEQYGYNGRQQVRRRPPPTVYPPLRSELMQEEHAKAVSMSAALPANRRNIQTVRANSNAQEGTTVVNQSDSNIVPSTLVGISHALPRTRATNVGTSADRPVLQVGPRLDCRKDSGPLEARLTGPVNNYRGDHRHSEMLQNAPGIRDGEESLRTGLTEQAQFLGPDIQVGTGNEDSPESAPFDEQHPATRNLIGESGLTNLDQDSLNFWNFVPDESFWAGLDQNLLETPSGIFNHPSPPEAATEGSSALPTIDSPVTDPTSATELPITPTSDFEKIQQELDEAGYHAVYDMMDNDELESCGLPRRSS